MDAFSKSRSLISKSDKINRSANARRVVFDCFCISAQRASADETPVGTVVDLVNIAIIISPIVKTRHKDNTFS